VVDSPVPVPQTEPQVSLDDIVGDEFRADIEVAFAEHLLKMLHVAEEHDNIDTVLAKGTDLARKLDDVYELIDMIREDDVRHACSLYMDPAQQNGDMPKETLLCVQLINSLA